MKKYIVAIEFILQGGIYFMKVYETEQKIENEIIRKEFETKKECNDWIKDFCNKNKNDKIVWQIMKHLCW